MTCSMNKCVMLLLDLNILDDTLPLLCISSNCNRPMQKWMKDLVLLW